MNPVPVLKEALHGDFCCTGLARDNAACLILLTVSSNCIDS